MTLGAALAVLIITFFVFFIVWGRTGSGQALLTRIFGPPPSVKKPAAKSPGRRTRSIAAPATKGTAEKRKPSTKRPAAKRAAKR